MIASFPLTRSRFTTSAAAQPQPAMFIGSVWTSLWQRQARATLGDVGHGAIGLRLTRVRLFGASDRTLRRQGWIDSGGDEPIFASPTCGVRTLILTRASTNIARHGERDVSAELSHGGSHHRVSSDGLIQNI